MLSALASDVHAPLEFHAVEVLRCGGGLGASGERSVCGRRNEQHPEDRHRVGGELAQRRRVSRDVAPAEDFEPFVGHDRLDCCGSRFGILSWQEGCADGVLARRRQLEAADFPQEGVGYLHRDADAIAHVCFRTRCAAMVEVDEARQGLLHHGAARNPGHVCYEADAACIVFKRRVVQALCFGWTVERVHAHSGTACRTARVLVAGD